MNNMKRILFVISVASLLAFGVGFSLAGTSSATRYNVVAPTNVVTSVANTNITATTTNGTVYLITNVVTIVTTNSTKLYPNSDNSAQVAVFNRLTTSTIWISGVNPVTNGQGWAIAASGSLTFPTVAGGAVPSTLYAFSTNALLTTNAVETEVWDSNASK